MIDRRTIFEIHRLRNERYSIRKIARLLNLSRKSVNKYLHDPNPDKIRSKRSSKLGPFKEPIAQMLEKDPEVSAAVIRQRIIDKGFQGGYTIVKDYLRSIRGDFKKSQPFIRFESAPGEQCQVDWGHFGSITYGETKRKLYCLAVLESYSRLLYLETGIPPSMSFKRLSILSGHPQRTGDRQYAYSGNRTGRTTHKIQRGIP